MAIRALSTLRATLKNNRLASACYLMVWSWFRMFLYCLSPVLLSKYRYRTMTGKRLNLKEPRTFDEKLLWLMHYWRHPLKTQCADKFGMRLYVKEQGLGHLLPGMLGVYEHASEIDFSVFPGRFVLKCTHGCKMNIICTDKNALDVETARRRLDRWLKTDRSYVAGENHYALIKPRIICECYLGDPNGVLPSDYKVYCFSGCAHCTLACTGRDRDGRGAKFDIYDRDWENKLPYSKSSALAARSIAKPDAYEEMIAAAERLSKPFPFVRVDFYSVGGKAVIGEMTFTPAGCIDPGCTEMGQQKLGELIKLPEKLLR